MVTPSPANGVCLVMVVTNGGTGGLSSVSGDSPAPACHPQSVTIRTPDTNTHHAHVIQWGGQHSLHLLHVPHVQPQVPVHGDGRLEQLPV